MTAVARLRPHDSRGLSAFLPFMALTIVVTHNNSERTVILNVQKPDTVSHGKIKRGNIKAHKINPKHHPVQQHYHIIQKKDKPVRQQVEENHQSDSSDVEQSPEPAVNPHKPWQSPLYPAKKGIRQIKNEKKARLASIRKDKALREKAIDRARDEKLFHMSAGPEVVNDNANSNLKPRSKKNDPSSQREKAAQPTVRPLSQLSVRSRGPGINAWTFRLPDLFNRPPEARPPLLALNAPPSTGSCYFNNDPIAVIQNLPVPPVVPEPRGILWDSKFYRFCEDDSTPLVQLSGSFDSTAPAALEPASSMDSRLSGSIVVDTLPSSQSSSVAAITPAPSREPALEDDVEMELDKILGDSVSEDPPNAPAGKYVSIGMAALAADPVGFLNSLNSSSATEDDDAVDDEYTDDDVSQTSSLNDDDDDYASDDDYAGPSDRIVLDDDVIEKAAYWERKLRL